MNAGEFISAYEAALACQSWETVAPLIHRNVCVTFSSGSVHRGKTAVGEAYARNFTLIRNERYAISDVHWVTREDDVAVYLFAYAWSGEIDGRAASGSGRGTAVIVREDGRWLLLAEHLGPGAPSARAGE